jgi:hypothetical protein
MRSFQKCALKEMSNVVTCSHGLPVLTDLHDAGKPENMGNEGSRGLNDEPVGLQKGERISFSHLLSLTMCHQWSVKGRMERSSVNFLTELKRLGKRPCELLACVFLSA